MRQILLTRCRVANVDDEDYFYLLQWKWSARYDPKCDKWYAVRDEKKPFRKHFRMHRVITNAPKGMEVDHIDGDGLNNTRQNLRVCTKSQNMQNQKINTLNTSGYKGVSLEKRSGKVVYRSYITCNKKRIFLGYFSTTEDAARVRDEAAKKYHGEFAKLNFE